MGQGSLLAMALLACTSGTSEPLAREDFPTPFSTHEAPSTGESAFAPLPMHVELDQRKVALGERLFTDVRISGDGRIACVTCHALERGGANGEYRTGLPNREPVAVNVPTVFNAAFNARFGWSGRHEDVGQIMDVAMTSPTVFAGTWERAAASITGDPDMQRAFREIYPEGITATSVREAIATYCLSLVTPNSRFDRYLRQEITLTSEEQAGYELFREYGCVSCHQGINIGGNMLQRFGVMRDYFAERGHVGPSDYGLYAATGREEDRFVFRVPSLRNVAETGPYFHDGSAETLEDAVVTMARYQLGRELGPLETARIVAFLRTLTGALAGRTT